MWTLVSKVISLFFFFFKHTVQVCHSFSSKEQAPFNSIAAVTLCSDFRAHTHKCLTVSTSISLSICHLIPLRWQSRRMHIHVLGKNTKISMSCWKSIDRILDPTKKRYPCPRAKENLKQDGKSGIIALKINLILQRHLERAKGTCVHQDLGQGAVTCTATEPDLWR